MIRLLLALSVALVTSCGRKPVTNPGPMDVTLGELLVDHPDKYRGLVVRLFLDMTEVDHISHTAVRRLKPDLKPVVRVYFNIDSPLPKPGWTEITARVLTADHSPGDRGVPDIRFTLILTDARVVSDR